MKIFIFIICLLTFVNVSYFQHLTDDGCTYEYLNTKVICSESWKVFENLQDCAECQANCLKYPDDCKAFQFQSSTNRCSLFVTKLKNPRRIMKRSMGCYGLAQPILLSNYPDYTYYAVNDDSGCQKISTSENPKVNDSIRNDLFKFDNFSTPNETEPKLSATGTLTKLSENSTRNSDGLTTLPDETIKLTHNSKAQTLEKMTTQASSNLTNLIATTVMSNTIASTETVSTDSVETISTIPPEAEPMPEPRVEPEPESEVVPSSKPEPESKILQTTQKADGNKFIGSTTFDFEVQKRDKQSLLTTISSNAYSVNIQTSNVINLTTSISTINLREIGDQTFNLTISSPTTITSTRYLPHLTDDGCAFEYLNTKVICADTWKTIENVQDCGECQANCLQYSNDCKAFQFQTSTNRCSLFISKLKNPHHRIKRAMGCYGLAQPILLSNYPDYTYYTVNDASCQKMSTLENANDSVKFDNFSTSLFPNENVSKLSVTKLPENITRSAEDMINLTHYSDTKTLETNTKMAILATTSLTDLITITKIPTVPTVNGIPSVEITSPVPPEAYPTHEPQVEPEPEPEPVPNPEPEPEPEFLPKTQKASVNESIGSNVFDLEKPGQIQKSAEQNTVTQLLTTMASSKRNATEPIDIQMSTVTNLASSISAINFTEIVPQTLNFSISSPTTVMAMSNFPQLTDDGCAYEYLNTKVICSETWKTIENVQDCAECQASCQQYPNDCKAFQFQTSKNQCSLFVTTLKYPRHRMRRSMGCYGLSQPLLLSNYPDYTYYTMNDDDSSFCYKTSTRLNDLGQNTILNDTIKTNDSISTEIIKFDNLTNSLFPKMTNSTPLLTTLEIENLTTVNENSTLDTSSTIKLKRIPERIFIDMTSKIPPITTTNTLTSVPFTTSKITEKDEGNGPILTPASQRLTTSESQPDLEVKAEPQAEPEPEPETIPQAESEPSPLPTSESTVDLMTSISITIEQKKYSKQPEPHPEPESLLEPEPEPQSDMVTNPEPAVDNGVMLLRNKKFSLSRTNIPILTNTALESTIMMQETFESLSSDVWATPTKPHFKHYSIGKKTTLNQAELRPKTNEPNKLVNSHMTYTLVHKVTTTDQPLSIPEANVESEKQVEYQTTNIPTSDKTEIEQRAWVLVAPPENLVSNNHSVLIGTIRKKNRLSSVPPTVQSTTRANIEQTQVEKLDKIKVIRNKAKPITSISPAKQMTSKTKTEKSKKTTIFSKSSLLTTTPRSRKQSRSKVSEKIQEKQKPGQKDGRLTIVVADSHQQYPSVKESLSKQQDSIYECIEFVENDESENINPTTRTTVSPRLNKESKALHGKLVSKISHKTVTPSKSVSKKRTKDFLSDNSDVITTVDPFIKFVFIKHNEN